MNELETEADGKKGDKGNIVIGLILLIVGSALVFSVMNGSLPEAGNDNPAWMILFSGLSFQATGFAVIVQHPFWKRDEMPTLKIGLHSLFAGFYFLFAVISGWIGYGTSTPMISQWPLRVTTMSIVLMGVYHLNALIEHMKDRAS